MKTQTIKSLLLLLAALSPQLKGEGEYTIKFRAAAFLPSSDRVRAIYGNSFPDYQLEATYGLYDFCELWANLDGVNRHGSSEHLKSFTSMKMVSFAFGASLVGAVREDLRVYMGCGYSLSYAWIHNRKTRYHRHQDEAISGVLFKSGVVYDITCEILAEVFMDYLYQGPQFKSGVRLGGLKLGAGVGYRF